MFLNVLNYPQGHLPEKLNLQHHDCKKLKSTILIISHINIENLNFDMVDSEFQSGLLSV
jgi:hypothetical protein